MSGLTLLKLKMLLLYRGGLRGWYREVWSQDGAARMCCDGHMCGCQGSDHESFWQWHWDSRPTLLQKLTHALSESEVQALCKVAAVFAGAAVAVVIAWCVS